MTETSAAEAAIEATQPPPAAQPSAPAQPDPQQWNVLDFRSTSDDVTFYVRAQVAGREYNVNVGGPGKADPMYFINALRVAADVLAKGLELYKNTLDKLAEPTAPVEPTPTDAPAPAAKEELI